MTGPTPEQRAQLEKLQQMLTTGLAYHEAGRLLEAQPLYEAVLKVLPKHPETLHLYGTLLHQLGDNDKAVETLQRAIELNSASPAYHNHLAAALLALHRYEEALDALDQAIGANPAYAEAHLNRATALAELDRVEEALEAAQEAAKLAPNLALARMRLGVLTARQLPDDAAEESEEKKEARLQSAQLELEEALRLDPLLAEACLHLAIVYKDLGNYERQIQCVSRGIVSSPAVYELYTHIVSPANMDDVTGARAVKWAKRSTVIRPASSQLWASLSTNAFHMNDFVTSDPAAKRSQVIEPSNVTALATLVLGLLHSGQYEKAPRLARIGLAIDPSHTELPYSLSMASFVVGDTETAWNRWIDRTSMGAMVRYAGVPQPEWDGRPLESGTLLVCSEQGIGDEVMFLSCLPDLLNDVSDVVVECDERWHPLLKRSYPTVKLCQKVERLASHTRRSVDLSAIVADFKVTHHVHAGHLPAFYRRER